MILGAHESPPCLDGDIVPLLEVSDQGHRNTFGIISFRLDVRWRLRPDEFRALQEQQFSIAAACLPLWRESLGWPWRAGGA